MAFTLLLTCIHVIVVTDQLNDQVKKVKQIVSNESIEINININFTAHEKYLSLILNLVNIFEYFMKV